MSEKLVTPAEAAKILAVSPKAIDHRRRSGEIPFVRVGRLIRYRLATIQQFIADNEQQLPPRVPRRPRLVKGVAR